MATTLDRIEAPDRVAPCCETLAGLLADDRLAWRACRSFDGFEAAVCNAHRGHWRPCESALMNVRGCWPKAWKRIATPGGSFMNLRYAFLAEDGRVVALARSRAITTRAGKLANVLEGIILPEPTPIDQVT